MSNPAEQLRAAREAAGLSLRDVEERIQVRAHYLKAIEEGNFSALPGNSYTRAIIRSYAQCVGISPLPILLYYEKQSQRTAAGTLAPSRRHLPSRRERYAGRKGRWTAGWKPAFLQSIPLKYVYWALPPILLLVVSSTLYFFDVFGSEPKGEAPAGSPPRVEAESPPRAEPSSPPSHSVSSEDAGVTVNLVKASESNRYGDEYAIRNADQVIVTITARAESWFRARGGGPTRPVIKDGYLKPGQTETFEHPEWISLHLGKPDQVEVRVNGYLVDTQSQSQPHTYQFRLAKGSSE